MSLWRMFDPEPAGMFPTTLAEARHLNPQGWGIFWTVNTFTGARRIANLVRVDFWAVDIDDGSKADQRTRLHRGLEPTRIVETKRGFQAYWRAVGATKEGWPDIVADRLVGYYGADSNAKDLARVLRVPGFLHMKNPAEPFEIREVYTSKREYTEAQMLSYYPSHRKQQTARPRPLAFAEDDERKRFDRAKNYLAHIPGAVSGQGGHRQTFLAALILIKGFCLSETAALNLLLSDYNQRCMPQWSEKEMLHKVKSAVNATAPEGFKLARSA